MNVSSDAEDLAAEAMSDGKGLQHVSGLAQSESSWLPGEASCGDQMPSSGRSMKVLNTDSVGCGGGP